MSIGDKIRQVRRQKDLSQAWLADQVGIAVSYVSMIETGRSDPDSELIKKFAKALAVSPALFFEEETDQSANKEARIHFSMPGSLTIEEREKIGNLIDELMRADAKDREYVLDLVNRVLTKK